MNQTTVPVPANTSCGWLFAVGTPISVIAPLVVTFAMLFARTVS